MSPAVYTPRWSAKLTLAIWLVWLVLAVVLCWPGVRDLTGDLVALFPAAWGAVAALLVLAAGPLPLAYVAIRKRGIGGWEPVLAASAALAACLWYAPLATVVVGAMFLAAFGAGRFALRRLELKAGAGVAGIVLPAAFGLGVLVAVLTLLGVAGGYRWWVFALLLAVPMLLFRRDIAALGGLLRGLQARWGEERNGSPLLALALVFGAILIVCALVVILTPSIWADPLMFHLPLAQHYAAAGALTPMPSLAYGYNPQGMELLLTVAVALAGQSGAQLVHPLFFVLLILALYAIARELGLSRSTSLAGCVFAAALPFLHWTGVNMKNDVAVAFFQLAGLLAFLRWLKDRDFRWIFLGTFLAASAFDIKIPAAFGVLGLAVLYVSAAWRQPRRVLGAAACLGVFLAFGTFWMARALVERGDPFYPNNAVEPFRTSRAKAMYTPTRRLERALGMPWWVHFRGDRTFRKSMDAAPGVFLIVTVPLWILWRRKQRSAAAVACAVFVGVSLAGWSLHLWMPRFAIAPIALLVLLAAARLEAFAATRGWLAKRSVYLAAAVSLVISTSLILRSEINAGQFQYLAGKLDRTAYLRQTVQTYPVLEVLARYAQPGDKVAAVRNGSRAYSPDPDEYYYFSGGSAKRMKQPIKSLRAGGSQFLIFPATDEFEFLAVAAGAQAELLYQDQFFRLYRL